MNPVLSYLVLSQLFVVEQTISPSLGFDGDRFGSAIVGGDFDGDGFDELLVGAHEDAAVYVYSGGPTGLDLASEAKRSDSDGGYGEAASVGDLDGDGYGDAVVGARLGQGVGTATVLYGGAAGLGARVETLAAPDPAGTSFGAAVATGGDLDGDGYDDLVVGAYQTGGGVGALHVYYGGAAGLDRARDEQVVASDAGPATLYGRQVAFVGDVNGDGEDDVVVGAEFDGTAGSLAGAVYLYLGGSLGIDVASEVKIPGRAAGDQFGSAVAGAGDVDGDGYDDVLVGAYGDARGGVHSGAVWVLHGGPSGLDRARDVELFASDAQAEAVFGRWVAGLGDVDGDGFGDVAVGSFGADGDEGAVYVFFGGPTGLDPASEVRIAGGVPLAAFGHRVAGLDANGDGFADLAAGGNYDQQAVARPVSLFFGDCRVCGAPTDTAVDTAGDTGVGTDTGDTGSSDTGSSDTGSSDTGSSDTGATGDTGSTEPPSETTPSTTPSTPTSTDGTEPLSETKADGASGGCGCASGHPAGVVGWLGRLAGVGARRR